MTTTSERRGPYAIAARNRDRITPESRKIVDQLVRARREAGMTQHELARAIGHAHHFISELESGKREPRLDVVAHYARGVGLPWIEVF